MIRHVISWRDRAEPQRAPTCTFLDLVRECPGLLAIIVFVWGVEAFLSKLLEAPKVLP